MANKAQFLIEILGDNVKAIKSIDQVTGKVNTLEGKTKSFSGIAGQLGGVFTTLGIGIAAGAFGTLIKHTIDLGDELNDMSKRTGVSVEQLSTLKYAAELSGRSMEGLSTSLKFLNKNLYEAAGGNKELVNVFNQLGIPAKDAAGNITSADQALYKIADKFKSMPDGVEKTALSMKVFGRSGEEVIPMLNEGSDGLMKMQQEAEKLGLQMSTKTAQEMDAFNDQLARIKGSAEGAAVSFVSAFGPAMVSILDNFAGGLDVILGKTELINGVQFKNLGLSIAQTNDIQKELTGSTKEYREDLIKLYETQIGIAKATAIADQFKLDLMHDQAGLITLFTDEDNILAENIRKNKTIANTFQQQVDIIKRFGTVSKENNFISEEAKRKAEDLQKEWEKTSRTIQYDINTLGLPSQAKLLHDLINKTEELKIKYKSIPGAIDNLNNDLKKQIAAAFRISSKDIIPLGTFQNAIETDLRGLDFAALFNQDKRIANPFEIPAELKERTKYDIEELGTYQLEFARDINRSILADTLLTEEQKRQVVSDSVGNMTDTMAMLYEITGSKSKELFALHKAFSVGQAIMNTYEGASKAIAQGGIFGGIMAASVIAMGLAQVAKIASTQPGSSGGGGISSSSMPSIPRNNSITNNSSSTTNNRAFSFTININSEVLAGENVDKWVRDKLGPSIEKAANDGIINFGGN